MTSTDSLKEIHAGREVVYASLSKLLLRPPTAEIYEMLEFLVPNLKYMSDANNKAIEALGVFVAKRAGFSDKARKEFDLDMLRAYTRLFCLTDSVPVSESYYTSVEHLVMQESRDQVMNTYKKTGFSFDDDSNEPEDHIAYELMYISYLAKITQKEISLGGTHLSELINMQQSFINNHLLNWIDEFVAKISEYGAYTELYLPTAQFMRDYCQADRIFLEDTEKLK